MAIKPCKECGKEISTEAKTCPNCGKRFPTGGISRWQIIGIILFSLYIVGSLIGKTGSNKTSGVDAPSQKSSPQVEEAERKTYTNDQQQAAQTVMENARGFANIFEEGDRLVVEFKMYIGQNDKNQQLAVATAIANADAVIQGKARVIYFQQPDGTIMATARPGSGIRLE